MTPAYIQRLQPAFPGQSELEIELKLITTPGVEKLTGVSPAGHCLRAMTMLFPTRVENPWRRRMVEGFFRARAERRKEYMILGASNSTKTSTIADLLLTIWWAVPKATTEYLASPYEDATETGLWARVLEQFQEAKDIHPNLPGKVRMSELKIIESENNPLSFIKVISIDQVGKLVGKKSKVFGLGAMIIASDELPEFKRNGDAIGRVMNNLISVPNMMLVGAGNFASPHDGLGRFCEPDLTGGYEGLRVGEHYEWTTTRGGIVYRFDGDQSPNILANDDTLFPFLPTLDYRERLARQSGGPTSPDFFRYWHSFPLLNAEEFTVTNLKRIREGKCLESFEWTGAPLTLGSHCDPGFGGDAAVIQDWRVGMAKTADGSAIQVWEAWGPPVTIPIDVTSELTPEQQIVAFHRDHCATRGIPDENVSFDGSMRAGIVQTYGRDWSPRIVALDYNGPATERPMSLVREFNSEGELAQQIWRDKVANLITEMWLATASLIISGQMRGLASSLDTAVSQLCKRRWRWVGKKKQIETKKEFKAHNSGKSPNEADGIVGGVEMARRRGLVLHGVSAANGGSMKLLLSLIEEKARNEAVKRITNPTAEPALPSGRLRGMNRPNRARSGVLHR